MKRAVEPTSGPGSRPAILLALALALGGCHVEPPAEPDGEAQLRRQANADLRAAQAEWEQAQAQKQQAAASALEAASALRLDQDHVAEAEQYAKAIAEAQAVARACDVDVDRLIELHKYLVFFDSEPQRNAAIAGLERCRERAARAHKRDDRLARPWVPAPAFGHSTPRALDALSASGGAALERLGRSLPEAEQRLQASTAALAHVEGAVEDARDRLQRLDHAQLEREEQWRVRMFKSVRPIWITGSVFFAGSAISVLASMAMLEGRAGITSGERTFETAAARDDALRANTRAQLACYAVAVPLLAAGVVLLVVGKRRWTASGIQLSTATGGLVLRF